TVDGHHAELQQTSETGNARRALRVQIGDQPGLGVVGLLQHVVLTVEGRESRDRPERLLAENQRIRRHVGENRGQEEIGPDVRALAAGKEPRTPLQRIGHMLLLFRDGARIDEWADVGVFETRSDRKRAHLFGKGLHKGAVDRLLDIEAVCREAVLARCGELRRNRAFQDRKSTRLNSSHVKISYAVFCLKKKKNLPRDYT